MKLTPEFAREVIGMIAAKHGLTTKQLLRKSRRFDVLSARWSAMTQLRIFGFTLKAIGQAFGGLHHSTVLYGLKQQEIRWL